MFGKGKLKCWKVLKSDPQFMNAFILLGSAWELDDETFKTHEKHVCELYGEILDVSLNEARYKIFEESYEKKTSSQIYPMPGNIKTSLQSCVLCF